MKLILFTFLTILFISCSEKKPLNVQTIVDKSIEISGGKKYQNFDLEFDFRKRHYIIHKKNGLFSYERLSNDSIKDVVNNHGFTRFINNKPVSLPDSIASRYANAINSVVYFVLLPNGLNDQAVVKQLIGKKTIYGKEYYKIKVTFKEEGGGDDFDDIYIYWINKNTFKVDYLAYYFHTNGGGFRFREAYNERNIKGIRIVDYKNYKPLQKHDFVGDLDTLFIKNKLKLVSKIENKNVVIN